MKIKTIEKCRDGDEYRRQGQKSNEKIILVWKVFFYYSFWNKSFHLGTYLLYN